MSADSHETQNTKESYETLAATLSTINETIQYRDLYLKAFERLLISKYLKKQISLLNLGSLRKVGLRSAREGSMLQLEVKMLRRSLFFLRSRKLEIEKEMQKFSKAAPTTTQQDTTADTITAEATTADTTADTTAEATTADATADAITAEATTADTTADTTAEATTAEATTADTTADATADITAEATAADATADNTTGANHDAA